MVWLDDGTAVTDSEFIAMIRENLEWLAPTDPAYTEQVELLREMTKE